MASLALTRPFYSQEGKISLLQTYISFISHKQLNCPSTLLFKEKLSFDITFPLLNQMWIIFNSLGYNPAQEVGTAVRTQSIVLTAESSKQCWQL